MMNESITREQTRLRVQNHRKKHGNKAGNESGNEDVTPKKSEVISQKSEAEKQTASVSVADVSATSDEDWLNQLGTNPAYSLIDVRREYSKMQTWCSVNHKMPTRRRFVAWLNRIEKPMDAAKGSRAHESIIDRS
jgi:hypothetical protein